MSVPPGIERAAHQAALKVKKMLIEMLLAEQTGAVGVEVTVAGLQPIQRVEQRDRVIRVSRQQATPIERIKA